MSYLIQYVRKDNTLYAITYKWNLKNKLVNTTKINRLIDRRQLVFIGEGSKGARIGVRQELSTIKINMTTISTIFYNIY